jgi:hypothetical protein
VTKPIEAGLSGAVDGGPGADAGRRVKKAYSAPTLVRWGAVEDLTRGGPGIKAEGGTTGSGGGG